MQHLKQSDIESRFMFVLRRKKNNTVIAQDIWSSGETHLYLNGFVTGVAENPIFTFINLNMVKQ